MRGEGEEEERDEDGEMMNNESSNEEEWVRKKCRVAESHMNNESLLGQSKNIQQCFEFSNPDPIL